MKRKMLWALAMCVSLQALTFGQQAGSKGNAVLPDLEAGFHNPPQSARPLTFWMWMNGNVSKEGITADLEAFKRVGMGGTEQFLIGGADSGIPETLNNPSVVFMGEKWRGLEHFAETESARLGLEFGTHNCPGWSSSGGPWITPAQSMQKVISGETTFRGPGRFSGMLPTGKVLEGYYGDIAVLAFKTERYTGPTVSKGPVPGMTGQYPVGAGRGTPTGWVPRESIVDLTAKMGSDGTLTWDAPEGEWTIARIGHTSTGKTNVAGPAPGTGLECDKMDSTAVEAHYRAYPAKLLEDAGNLVGGTFKRFEIDSYEVGPQDWTGKMREEFQNRRGYDITPWLVYATGRNIVDGKGGDVSSRFENDWNLTIAELFAEKYYGTLQKLIHETPGLEFMVEPYNTSRYSPMDTNNLSRVVDLVTAEFWQRPSTWGWTSVKPTTSSAHTWGKNLVAAEAFTGQPDFAFQSDPYLLKATGDRAWAAGINRLVFHTSAHQPWMNVAPGMTMGQFGTHFGRTITWWEHGAKEWVTYLARSQYLLQQGRSVGDLCFLQYDRRMPTIPAGYDGDNIGTEVLLHHVTVENGRIALANGISYAALVLPELRTMRADVLQKIKELVSAGAVVIGPKPERSSSLTGYPTCDQEVTQLGGELWGDADGKAATEHAYGSGKVFCGVKPAEALAKLGVMPDVQIEGKDSKAIVWIHRHVDGVGEIYFVSNQGDEAATVDATFRVAGERPELWHAETDVIEPAPVWEAHASSTRVPLMFGPSGSVFVVFRGAASGDHVVSMMHEGKTAGFDLKHDGSAYRFDAFEPGNYQMGFAERKVPAVTMVPALPASIDLSANWDVRFPPKLGAPATVTLPTLMNLSQHGDPGVKYFSGTMTYTKTFELPADAFGPSRVLRLDLGKVKNVAEVRVNGKSIPLMWLPPFQADATSLLHVGSNTLEIQVTNLWVNRLVGDEQEPDDLDWTPPIKLGAIESGRALLHVPDWIDDLTTRPSKGRVTFVTFKHFKKDSPLPMSGLIGPVRIESGERVELQ